MITLQVIDVSSAMSYAGRAISKLRLSDEARIVRNDHGTLDIIDGNATHRFDSESRYTGTEWKLSLSCEASYGTDWKSTL